MWPFFVLAYGKIHVRDYMDFKSRAYFMSDEEYAQFYRGLGNSISRRRITDLNEASITEIISSLPKDEGLSVLDVGAGNGYLLRQLGLARVWKRIVGVDVAPLVNNEQGFEVVQGVFPNLPFSDREFDVVTCTHVLEHVIDLPAAVRELIRVARRKVLIVVPKQRYYYFTLDEHLNFFPHIDPMIRLFYPNTVAVALRDGDWVIAVSLGEE
jgi:SAM-dependent methyltransferase